MKYVLTIALILCSSFTYAGTRHPSVSSKQVSDYGSKFIHTVMVMGKNQDGGTFAGSGVVINETHVLTAAHVVWEAKTCNVITSDKRSGSAIQIVIPKEFDLKKFGNLDIAIIKLDKPLKFTFYPKLYTEDDEVGKTCAILGYGASGTFDKGISGGSFSPALNGGTNKVNNVYKDLLICDASKKKETALEYLINSGDSGGPLFIDKKIAGIHSGVIASDRKPNGDYGDESGHTRVSKFYDWIMENSK